MAINLDKSSISTIVVGSMVVTVILAVVGLFTTFATKQELRDAQIGISSELEAMKKENKSFNDNMTKENKDQKMVLDNVRDNTTRIMTTIEIMQRNQIIRNSK